jgi:aldehyde:ferredoxin oxidoreductase
MAEVPAANGELRPATDFTVGRYHVDLGSGGVRWERVACEDLEDALGGIARATKYLGGVRVTDPYDPSSPLLMNLGLLSGTRVMTGLRTFFNGYSPLKGSQRGAPGLMWSTGSGNFGPKLRGLGIDDVVFTGRAPRPTLLRISPSDDPAGPGGPARFEFLDGGDLTGRMVNDRIQDLHARYADAHFAVVGRAAEHYDTVRYAGIALSTDNQLKTGEPKPRWAGRGGFGGVLASKNLFAIAADGPNPKVSGKGLREVNKEINLGEGSARYRDLPHDRGGTWRTFKMMGENGGLPEHNFAPTATDVHAPLTRPAVEEGPYEVLAEGCYLCGIKCHKMVYDEGEGGEFRAKIDYEPIALLSTNLGILDPDRAFTLIELSDELGFDSISLGVTLGYAMEYNERHPDAPIGGGLSYGDADAVERVMHDIAAGRMPQLGQGTMRLSLETGDTAYAMHSKGLEYPAYQPQTNPAYPWALAGGHMSMRTFFLLVLERETGLDYWVDATVNRGPLYTLYDLTGLCKFANVPDEIQAEGVRIATGLDATLEDLHDAVRRTYLRGYAAERAQGFTPDDYAMPADAYRPMQHDKLPYFNTPEFFAELKERVMATLDERAAAAGYL